MFGYDSAHTFATTERMLNISDKHDISDWGSVSYHSGGGVHKEAVPSYYKGCFFVQQTSGSLSCIDGRTGELVWRKILSHSVNVAKPLVIGNFVFQTTYEGILSCLMTDDGKLNQRRDLGGKISTAPVSAGSSIFTITDDAVLTEWTLSGLFIKGYCDLAKELGENITVKDFTNPVTYTDSDGKARLVFATVSDELICVDISRGEVYSRDSILWRKKASIVSGQNALCSASEGVAFVDADGILRIKSWETGEDVCTLPIGDRVLTGVLSDGWYLYFATYSGEVHCVEIKSCASAWKKPYQLNGGVTGQHLALAEGKVYVGSSNTGRLYCLTQAAGQHVWTSNPGVPLDAGIAAGSSGVLALPEAGKGVCISLANGKDVKWRTEVGGLCESPPIVVGDKVYYCLTDGTVRCVSLSKAELIWQREFDGSKIIGSPAYSDGKIVVAPCNSPIVCLDASNGDYIWDYKMYEYIYAPPTINGNQVFVGVWKDYVYSFDLRRGSFQNFFRTSGVITSTPTITNDSIFIGSQDGSFSKYNRLTGKLEWFDPSGKIKLTSTSDDSRIFVPSGEKIKCIDSKLKYIKPIWTRAFDYKIVSNLATAGDRLYCITSDGTVQALNKRSGRSVWGSDVKVVIDGSFVSCFVTLDHLCVLSGKSITIIALEDEDKRYTHEFGFDIVGGVLAENRLVLTTHTGSLILLSPRRDTRFNSLPTVRYTLTPSNEDELLDEARIKNTTPDKLSVW